MFVLYRIKTSNDFYDIQHSVKYEVSTSISNCQSDNYQEALTVIHKKTVHIIEANVRNVADLKQCLIAAWCGLQQHVINETIDQWRGRLRACMRTVGRQFERFSGNMNSLLAF